jgi:hypothetical protein
MNTRTFDTINGPSTWVSCDFCGCGTVTDTSHEASEFANWVSGPNWGDTLCARCALRAGAFVEMIRNNVLVRRLDLGGTADGEGPGWTGVSLDRSGGSENMVKGDYNQMPYPDNTFCYAWGSCYLEGSDGTTNQAMADEFWEHRDEIMAAAGIGDYDDSSDLSISEHNKRSIAARKAWEKQWAAAHPDVHVDPWTGDNNFAELYRVMAPGGYAVVGACGSWPILKTQLNEEGDETPLAELNYDFVQSMFEDLVKHVSAATKAGFKVEVEYENRGDEPNISVPWLILTKSSRVPSTPNIAISYLRRQVEDTAEYAMRMIEKMERKDVELQAQGKRLCISISSAFAEDWSAIYDARLVDYWDSKIKEELDPDVVTDAYWEEYDNFCYEIDLDLSKFVQGVLYLNGDRKTHSRVARYVTSST